MNKKLLSTVMAGTMLATSVAPVFAEYKINKTDNTQTLKIKKSEKEKFKEALLKKMQETLMADNGSSIYGIRTPNDKDVVFFNPNVNIPTKPDATKDERIEEAKNSIKRIIDGNDKFEVIDKGHVTVDGKGYYHYYQKDEFITRKYTEELLKEEFENWNTDKNKKNNYSVVDNMTLEGNRLTITFKDNKHNPIELKVGDIDIEPSIALDRNGNETTNIDDFNHFENRIVNPKTYKLNPDRAKYIEEHPIQFKYVDKVKRIMDFKKNRILIEVYLKQGYTSSNNKNMIEIPLDSNVNHVNVPDFNKPIMEENKITGFKDYEERMFKGQKGDEVDGEIVADITFSDDADATDAPNIDSTLPIKPIIPDNKPTDPVYPIIPDNKPIKPDNKPTVKPIETIAGEDRYDTAIEVAKEIAPVKEIAENGSVLLVNGNALVDGLAAAPLASSVSTTNKVKAAPILLTKTDKLTTSTKDYIEELVSQKKSLSSGKLRVYIVGGEAVVSKNVEKELSDLGVEIIRAGGKNREETSLKVADLMSEKQKSSNAFVVGADGEADAMSIASIAASRKEPIIVSRKGGLSKSAIEKMASLKNTSATIIGGDKVVSANTEKSLKEANINSDRVAGVNRQDTNAKIINRYASSRLDKVLVSKDGQNKKDELVDALTATSLAVKYNAPIVLATNKISDAQIKAIKDNADTKGISISQIGHGIAENVINTIAEKVGLIK